jgi:eukaryotic-like serine/threonine-protein kinase
MALSIGTRLGLYEISDVLGAGGMGEVYRARDTKLGRSVAIKVILEPFAADSERVSRFEREAKVLASLNHQHIASLYGMEQAEGHLFLVMELVEGETLADRLARGPMAVEDALRVALQITDALEMAHEKGIVHRDLKPANIKITPDEKVKVLDFGLAKAMETDSAVSNVTNSPTLSMMATNAGVILGTAAYMSPEQAKGFPADHRSDVFSFGVVLYEMLTGRQPFQGETAPDILASVLVREPEPHRLSSDLNPRLPDLLRRCLEKSPKRRWQAIGDVRAELESIATAPYVAAAAHSGRPPAPLWKRAIPIIAAALLTGGVGAAVAWRLKPAPAGSVTRFSFSLPGDQQFTGMSRQVLAVAPDGKHLAYIGGGVVNLRAMGTLVPKPIQGTDVQQYQSVFNPVFSPDSQSVAFYAVSDRTIKRIAIAGGSAVTVCAWPDSPYDLTWSGNDTLLFSATDGVMRVAAAGGGPEKIMPLKADERAQRVQLLPGGEAILVTLGGSVIAVDRWGAARIVAYRLKTSERITLVENASDGMYLPTGHLAYAIGGTIYAVAFDAERLQVKGGPVPIVEGVRRAPVANTGIAYFGVSATGTLAYVPGPAQIANAQLDIGLVDRKGQVTPLKLPPGQYDNPRLSPDGRRVAVGMDDGKEPTILIYDLARGGAMQRFTFGGKNRFPIWTSDGKYLVFQSDRDGDAGIYWQPADGTRGPERLTKAAAGESHVPEAWSPGRDILLYSVIKGTENALWTYTVSTKTAAPFGGVTSRVPTDAVFSPDAKWIAYSHSEGAGSTVYVQPFPATGAMFQVVRRQGESPHHPMWSRNGTELIVNTRPPTLDVIQVSTRPTFTFGSATVIPKGFTSGPASMRRPFDLAPDGRILGLIVPGDTTGTTPRPQINVVLNWYEELKARVPNR